MNLEESNNKEHLNKAKSHMKAPKPSKTDILSELESIRHSLVDEPATISEPKQISDAHTADSLQKDIADINSELLTTLSLLDESQTDIKETSSINTNEEHFDEDDIPVLDDLVIDDDTCLETVNKITSASDIPENVNRAFKENIATGNGDKQEALEKESEKESGIKDAELTNAHTEQEQSLKLFENLDAHSELGSSHAAGAEASRHTNDSAIKTTLLESSAIKVLPGQRSLFDDDIHSTSNAKELTQESAKKHTPKPPLDKDLSFKGQSNIAKATKEIFNSDSSPDTIKENPFLPPHIRERLAQQKIVMADDAKAHVTALESLKSSASLLNSSSRTDEYTGTNSYYPDINAPTNISTNNFSTSELQNHIEKSIEIDTSALVREILSQKTELLADALLDAKNGLELSLSEPAHIHEESTTSCTSVDSSITDQLLIENLIQQLMPDLEKALRENLKNKMKQKDLVKQPNSLFDS